LRWSLGDLAAGASGQIAIVLRAPTTAISGTTYTNVAVIDTPTSSDRDSGNDTSSTISTVRPNADLALVKTGPATPIRSGSVITYTLAYRNNGPSQAQGVRIVDTPPPGFTFSHATPAPTSTADGQLTWEIGTLDAGASGSIAVVGTLAGEGATTTRTNTATISSPTTPDPMPGNNTSIVDTSVLKPDLSVTKTDNMTQAQPGDTLTYDLTVRNTGTTTATNVLLRETPPAGATVLVPGWTRQDDGAYTLAIGDVAAGESVTRQFALRLPNPLPALMTDIVNTVFVTDDSSAGPDPTPDDNTSIDTDAPIAGRIGDFVWYDKDGDGQQDDGEGGFGDVVVHLLDPDTDAVIATTTTDANGRYLFAGLRLGAYAVALAPQTTLQGTLRGYRYTTPLTPIGTIAEGAPDNLGLDIGLNNPDSTDVVLAYLRAEHAGQGVVVTWRTLEEVNTASFRVLRGLADDVADASEIAVVSSRGTVGGSYRVLDAEAPAGAIYWLVEVERGGKQTIYGPIRPHETPTSRPPTMNIYLPLAAR
jgi:uncharacterized repeat protein (TIGR01451 family)